MIEVKDLTKCYSGKMAVGRLSFTVRPGVVTGFPGPNSPGKSAKAIHPGRSAFNHLQMLAQASGIPRVPGS
jgi:ABC-2 type transport system ATP-binding protein